MLYNVELKTIFFLSFGFIMLMLSKPFIRWAPNKNPEIKMDIRKEYYYVGEEGNLTYYNKLKVNGWLSFIDVLFLLLITLLLLPLLFRDYEHSYLLFFTIYCLLGLSFVQRVLVSDFTFTVLF